MRLSRSDLELEVLVNRIDRDELDLQPDFQRGEVWDRVRQQRLIDTILRRWYIPPIHIVHGEADGRDLVLDGQQRLRTVHGFFHDKVAVAGRTEPLRPDLEELDGLLYSELRPDLRMAVQRFALTVITLTDYSPDEPAELFFRLNQQYTLTPPEKRNALFGAARDQVKELVRELSVDAITKATVGFSNGRLAYDDVLARFCLCLQNQSLVQPITNLSIEEFYRRERFSDDVLKAAREAARALGKALWQTGGARLNKATLFSWLVFAQSVISHGEGELSSPFVGEFETRRGTAASGVSEGLGPFLLAYNNRSSYRVADTASVLVRDLVLHLAHAIIAEPVGREADLLPLARTGTSDAEHTLLDFAQSSRWGNSLS